MTHSSGAAGHEPAAPQGARRRSPLLAAFGSAWLVMATAAGLLISPVDGGPSADDVGQSSAQGLVELFGGDVAGSQPADPAVAPDQDTATAPREPASIDGSGPAPTGGAIDATPVPYVPVRDSSIEQVFMVSDSPPYPVRLVIPDLGIDMAIGPVGVQPDGQMAVPDDVDDIGWYKFGSVPGASSGTTVLASHVDSWADGVGPFARLRNQATVGTWINVFRSDGSVRSYKVIDNRMIPKTNLPVETLFNRAGEHRLVLVTCGGRFQRDVGRYTDNIVVTAAPAGF